MIKGKLQTEFAIPIFVYFSKLSERKIAKQKTTCYAGVGIKL